MPQTILKAPTIMHVEDNDDHASLFDLSMQMDWPDAELHHFTRSTEALRWLEARPDYHPDMILLDLQMPEMDGHAFLEALQSHSACRHIPVAILTTSTNPLDKMRTDRAQVLGYFVKPCDMLSFSPLIAELRQLWLARQ